MAAVHERLGQNDVASICGRSLPRVPRSLTSHFQNGTRCAVSSHRQCPAEQHVTPLLAGSMKEAGKGKSGEGRKILKILSKE